MTEPTMPMSVPPSGDDPTTAPIAPGPEPKKKRRWVWPTVGVVAVLFVIGALANGGGEDGEPEASAPTPTATTAEPTPVEEVALGEAPDQTGVALNEARDALEGAGYKVRVHDSFETRSIVLESNWVVTDQTQDGSTVTLGAKKFTDPTAEEKAAADAAKAEAEAAEKAEADAAAAAKAAYDALPLGQKNAISKAQDYLGFMAFSRSGLIEQLEYEGFSTEDATFAVDYVAPDWYAQAAAKAQDYLDTMSFSRQGLIDQLVFEGFTADEAAHGAAAVGY